MYSEFKEALEELNPFQELKEITAKAVHFRFNGSYAEAVITLHGQGLMPKEIKNRFLKEWQGFRRNQPQQAHSIGYTKPTPAAASCEPRANSSRSFRFRYYSSMRLRKC